NGVRVLDGPHAASENRETNVTYVTPGYFEALSMKVMRGRLFTDADGSNAQPVAIVNEAFIRSFFHDDVPIARHLSLGASASLEIIGVVGDVPQIGFGDPLAAIPNVYIPAAQQTDAFFQLVHTWFAPSWVVRAALQQTQLEKAMSAAMAAVDPELPFVNFRTM